MRSSEGDKECSLPVPQGLRRFNPNSATGRSGRGEQADDHDEDGGRRENPRDVPPAFDFDVQRAMKGQRGGDADDNAGGDLPQRAGEDSRAFGLVLSTGGSAIDLPHLMRRQEHLHW